jgi:NADP-dependent 3-hydroxy acid dehydrogenase YdfG
MATRTKIKLEPLVIDGHKVGRVLITGASAGIGAELARAFAREGIS